MFTLESEVVVNGKLKDPYGERADKEEIVCGIPQVSFPMEWSGAPENTKSYAIVVMDYDNVQYEGVPFVHWIICNIPPNVTSLSEDASRQGEAFTQGTNSWSAYTGPPENIPEELTHRYGGPAPENIEHEYETTIYALDAVLDLTEGFYLNQLRKGMRGHVLAESTLYALY